MIAEAPLRRQIAGQARRIGYFIAAEKQIIGCVLQRETKRPIAKRELPVTDNAAAQFLVAIQG